MTLSTDPAFRFAPLPNPDQVFGCTKGMGAVRREIDEAMRDDLPVLIEGESGTGKEVIARYLHLGSPRSAGPFVRVNCGSLQGGVLGKEIFGEVPCAESFSATNPVCDSIGLASGGTLFFDGIAEMDWDLNLNGRLAMVLNRAASSNVRIVCASNMNRQIVGCDRKLSPDLTACFGHRVKLLSLRERKQDIPMLCEYLIGKFANGFGRAAPSLSSQVLDSFQQWHWPGNIRELENWIARIVIFGTEDAIGFDLGAKTATSGKSLIRSHRAIHVTFNRKTRSRRHS